MVSQWVSHVAPILVPQQAPLCSASVISANIRRYPNEEHPSDIATYKLPAYSNLRKSWRVLLVLYQQTVFQLHNLHTYDGWLLYRHV
jgi:hypothetical protein